MFSRKIRLLNKTVYLELSETPYYELENCLIFGFPINLEDAFFNLDNEILGNKLKGYWLKIDFADDKITITNDILGGYRLYYYVVTNKIYVSDNHLKILEKLECSAITKNKIEYDFWLKHRYTTGKSTFIEGLNKLNPASILEILDYDIYEKTYFKDISRKPNAINHKNEVHKDLLKTFSEIKELKNKVILLFSGGKDSCLLLQYLLYYKIPFVPVFLKLNPISKLGLNDIKRVRAVAKELGLDLDEIEIKLSDISKKQKEDIVKNQIFDRHFSLLHFMGGKAIREKYGEECLVINGQSSDSILSFGPSENSTMSYLRRHIMYRPRTIISKIGLLLLILKTKKKFRLPKNKTELLFALFDEFKYTRVLDNNASPEYVNYINNYIDSKTRKLKSFYSKEMYVKILSFCQGSDNHVVVNSSKINNLLTIMPFATPNIIYKTIELKDENLEIKQPKYVIEQILEKEFSFYYNNLKLKEVDVSDILLDINSKTQDIMDEKFIESVKNKFFNHLNSKALF